MKIFKSDKEYQIALTRLNEIFDAEMNTPEGGEAELLTILIEKYEEKDGWEETLDLTDEEKTAIDEGQEAIKEGRTIPAEDVWKELNV